MSEMKQIIVVRKDLKMSAGKLAAQVAHASVTAIMRKMGHDVDKGILRLSMASPINVWYEQSQTKIVVAVNSEEELRDLYRDVNETELPCSLIKDEGRTELGEPTYTAVAVGPGAPMLVDRFTGNLPLYYG